MAASNVGAAELQTPDRETEGEWKYDGNCKGMESRQGWQSVQDEVLSKPLQKVIQSIVANCSSEWYRVGITLGFSHGQVQDMTFNKPTFHGKLQVIIEKRLEVDGKGKAVQALLDVCGQIMPLAVIDVMKDLGIRYIDTAWDHFLYNVSKEMRHCWKKVARHLGLGQQDLATIKMKAKSSKKRARMMLELWYFRKKGVASENDMHKILKQIRSIKLTKSQIFPENFHGDKIVCGRQKELREIASEFWGPADDKETPTEIRKYCLQVVNGMGGIGKSAVAEKYATEWKEKYCDGIFHFNSDSLAALHISIRNNLHALSVEPTAGSVFEDNKAFLERVYTKEKVLLLYDGADDLDTLESILPRETAHVHVLITTRTGDNHSILQRADRITPLRRLEPDAGVEALQAWRGQDVEDLDQQEMNFARLLVSDSPIQGLPLAVGHAAALMRMTGINCQAYYELLKTRQAQLEALALDMDKLLHYFRISNLKEPLLRHGISKPSHLSRLNSDDIRAITVIRNEIHLLNLAQHFMKDTNPIHLTWQFDIESVMNTDINAMNLLSYSSLMSCRNIPEQVLQSLFFEDSSAFQYRKAISTLKEHALVDVSESNEGCTLHVHPLIQSTVLERIMRQPQELHFRLKTIARSLLRFLPESDEDIQHRLGDDEFLSLIPHVYAVAEKCIWICDDETCAYFVHVACMIAYLSQHIDVSVYLCNERLKATALTADRWQRLLALFNMGRSCELVINPQAAQLHLLEAKTLIETSNDQEKLRMRHHYLLVLDRLAKCYTDQQMYTTAASLYESLLTLLNENPAENRRHIATVLNNLAWNYSHGGQTKQAIRLYEEVLAMKTGDPTTPFVSLSTSYLNFGDCLMEDGQLEKALPVLEISLSILREKQKEDNLNSANVLRVLSSCCEQLGDLQKAEKLAEESVFIACHRLPNNHPHIAMYMSQLASCYRRFGRLEEAIKLAKQCTEICLQGLPGTRDHLCAYLNSLGQYYKENGMLDEAINTFEEGLVVVRSCLPPDHPNTGMVLWNLGGAYKERKDIVKASGLWKECLEIFKKCLSSTHPQLIEVYLALGEISFHQGLYNESLQMYAGAHEILMSTSTVSEKMATVYDNMGLCHLMLSQLDAAEESLSHSLRIYAAIFPQGNVQSYNTQQILLKVRQLKFGQ